VTVHMGLMAVSIAEAYPSTGQESAGMNSKPPIESGHHSLVLSMEY